MVNVKCRYECQLYLHQVNIKLATKFSKCHRWSSNNFILGFKEKMKLFSTVYCIILSALFNNIKNKPTKTTYHITFEKWKVICNNESWEGESINTKHMHEHTVVVTDS